MRLLRFLNRGRRQKSALDERTLYPGKLQISPLRYPGFPVENGVVGKVRAPLFAESRIRGRYQLQ